VPGHSRVGRRVLEVRGTKVAGRSFSSAGPLPSMGRIVLDLIDHLPSFVTSDQRLARTRWMRSLVDVQWLASSRSSPFSSGVKKAR
jgi:hypothetical protein